MKVTSEGQKEDNLVYVLGFFKSLLSEKRIESIVMERTRSYYRLVSEKSRQQIQESRIWILFDCGGSIHFRRYYHDIQPI